ncbi:MAG: copper homeostasis protein CutC, partial [Longimicrobiales bacterium]
MTSLHSGPSEPSAKPVLIEACVDSVASAQAAQAGGAGRLELCANLNDGGTTPSAGMIEAVLAQVQIPTFVIIRPRGGGFIYSTSELDVMRREILWARRLGAHGIVSGTLATDGRVQRAQLTALLESAGDLPFTFHRAFDLTPDLGEALEHLIEAGVVRVLTSGGAQTALDGADRIAQLVQQAGARNTVLAGGGINEDNVQEIVRRSGVTEVHV